MMASQEAKLLQFVPFQSTLDAGFWHELGRRKLEKYRLSSDPVSIRAHYTNACLPGEAVPRADDFSTTIDTVVSMV